MGVLVDEPLPVGADQAVHLDRLGDHRSDDAEKLRGAVVVAVSLVAEVDADRADGLALERDRRRDVGQFLLRQLGPVGGAIEERRLAAHPRHDDRLAALHHLAGNALAETVAHTLAWRDGAGGGLQLDLAGVFVEQHHRAPQRAVMAAEDLEHAVQPLFQIEGRRERLARFEKRRELPHLAGVSLLWLHPLREARRHRGVPTGNASDIRESKGSSSGGAPISVNLAVFMRSPRWPLTLILHLCGNTPIHSTILS